jgi:mannose-binding lectin 2
VADARWQPSTFPRGLAINGNGIERYNVGKDGAPQEVAGCSVSIRRAAVATKARLTYVKDVFLEVSLAALATSPATLTRAAQLALHYNEWDDWDTCL